MRPSIPTVTRQNLLCAAALGLVVLTAPFPRVQPVVHALLVLALAPRAGAPLSGALWAVAAGWAMETGLHLYPHPGGLAWANLTLTVLAGWMVGRWPLEGLKGWLTRLAALLVLHTLVIHGAVRLASGPHPWGIGWFWAGLSLPFWGWVSWRLLYAASTPRPR